MTIFRSARADEPPGATLIAAQLAELGARPGWVESHQSPSATPEEMAPPAGIFLVGWLDEIPVACGGIKRLEDDLAELKRFYVIPTARSKGVSIELMNALEDAARELGYTRLRMDTGSPRSASVGMSLGYAEIADYNGNPNAMFWGEKDLAGTQPQVQP